MLISSGHVAENSWKKRSVSLPWLIGYRTIPPTTGPTGWRRYSKDVTTPKFAPAPRIPQKRSAFASVLAVEAADLPEKVRDAALKEAVAYSQVRKTFGKPICEHQAIQLKLGEMATRLEAARLLTYRAAEAYDLGERCDMEAGMAKLFATEAAVENSLEAMRIHGGYGYSKEFNIERLYRDAPLLIIGEGTNEMQRIIIAKQLIERNRA